MPATDTAKAADQRAEQAQMQLKLADVVSTCAAQYLKERKHDQCKERLAKAKQHKEKADTLKQEAKALRAAAYQMLFNEHNKVHTNTWKIDFHGMGVQAAVQKLWHQLGLLQSMEHPGIVKVILVTGKGNHSANGKAKIKPAIVQWLDAAQQQQPQAISWQEVEDNAGRIEVFLNKCCVGGVAHGSPC